MITGDWSLRGRTLSPAPFYVWGIVNATPDSFHDGGQYLDHQKALAHALQLQSEGAAILDLGGASSRPGAEDVPAEEEIRRIQPLVQALRAEKALLSVDTWRADVARACLESGADIINDISAFSWEPELLSVVAQYKPGYVLMHCQGRPQTMQSAPSYAHIVDDVLRFFTEKMNELVRAGLPEDHIILDPGIGFGKTLEHNLALLRSPEALLSLGRPVLLGISHKSMFSHLLGIAADQRASATQVCTALAAEHGIRHHRVHDVALTVQTLHYVAQIISK